VGVVAVYLQVSSQNDDVAHASLSVDLVSIVVDHTVDVQSKIKLGVPALLSW
jgi:hypothetical protein